MKLLLFPLLFSFFLHCSYRSDSSSEQNDSVNISDSVNDSVLGSHDTLRYTLPVPLYYDEYRINNDVLSSLYLAGIVYPIGWSAQGAFAYVTEKAIEVDTVHQYVFYIRKVDNDSILWQYAFTEKDSFNYSDSISRAATWEKAWKKHAQIFTNQMNKHNIVQQRVFKAEYFLTTRYDIAVSSVDTKTGWDTNLPWGNYLKSEILVMSSKYGKKEISRKNYDDNTLAMAVQSFIIRSPYNNSDVMLSNILYRHGQAYTYLVDYDFIGVNIDKEFK